jgi:ABC-type glycerol-3-phosphate transport system substrate-binding protein
MAGELAEGASFAWFVTTGMALRRREFLAGAAAGGALLAAGAPAVAAIDYRKPPDWAKLVGAAKQEGTLTIYYPTGDTFYAALVTRFEKAFPEIKVESTFGVGAALLTRLQAERNAGSSRKAASCRSSRG